MAKRIQVLDIVLPSGETAGTYKRQIKIDQAYGKLTGVGVFELSNTSNQEFAVGLELSGNRIIDVVTRKFYDGSQTSPDQKLKTVDAKVDAESLDVLYKLTNNLTAPLTFQVLIELER